MIRSHRIVWTIAVLFTGAFVGSAAMAADAGFTVGIVDVARVNEAPRIKQLREKLGKLGSELDMKINIRLQNVMLTEEQVKELIDLKLKADPTEKDKARIKQLTDIERANDEELKKLQTTQQPTEKDKTRLKELTDMQQKSKATGDQIQRDYAAQYQSESMNLMTKADEEMREVINKIAVDKKLTFVFAKDVVFFGGTDITSDVISKLDRKPD